MFKKLDVKYLIFGFEVGDQGTPHLQGYLILKLASRLAAMKKIHSTAHWEVAKGSTDQNYEYCTKSGKFFENGVKPVEKGMGEKRRWDDAKLAAMEGRIDDVPSDIYLRFYRTLKEIRKDHMVKPPDLAGELTNRWYYGEAGSGKSFRAFSEYPDAYRKRANKWWDGYQGEDVVIIDDFDPEVAKYLVCHMKQWSDRYAFQAETKGGAMMVRPKMVVVTSQYRIDQCWTDRETIDAITRRFTSFRVLKGIHSRVSELRQDG